MRAASAAIAEHAVELVEPDQPADDIFARAERNQTVAARRGFIAHFGTDELRRRCRDLANAGLEQLAQRRDARFSAGGADDVGDVRADGRGGDREQLDAHRFGQAVFFDLAPQLVEVEQPFGDQESRNDLLERGALFFRQIKATPGPRRLTSRLATLVATISLRSRWARIASACALRIGLGKASNSCGSTSVSSASRSSSAAS